MRGLLLLGVLLLGSAARAEEGYERALGPPSPFAAELRNHWYAQLAKAPWRALGYELLLPGAGFAYVGTKTPAALTFALSGLGAGLWIAGAVHDRRALRDAGIATFAAVRVGGSVGAPLAASLLNQAFRRQLGLD